MPVSTRIPGQVVAKAAQATKSINPAAREYFKMLIDPFAHQSRMPDGQTLNTALFVSRRLVDIRVNLNNAQGVDAGRFAIMIRPRLGNANEPQNYTVNYVDTTNGWPANLDAPNAWVTQSSGDNLTVASDVEELIQPALTVFSRTTATNVVGDNCVLRIDTAPVLFSGHALSSDNLVTFRAEPFDAVNPKFSKLILEPGQYIVTLCYRVTYANAADPTLPTVCSVGGGVTFDVIDQHVTPYTSGGGTPRSRNTWTALVTVTNTAGEETMWFTAGDVGGTMAIDEQRLVISSTWAPAVRPAFDAGVLETIRPIAMAGFFKVALSPLDCAGRVTNYQIDAGQVQDVFRSSSSSNNPMRWEFSTKIPNSHDGPLGGGAYSFWIPDSYKFVDPATVPEHMAQKTSGLVFSGYYKPMSVPLTNTVTIARLEVVTIFEGTTSSTLYPKKSAMGTRDICDQARNLLRHENVLIPQNMNNDKHRGIVDKAISTVESVAKVGSLAATLAGFFF